MRGIILSHTRMTGEGFCTSLAIEDDTVPRQIRPRLAPNANTIITSFGLSEAVMVSEWRPGRPVTLLQEYRPVQPKFARPTHPEDVVFSPHRVILLPPIDHDVFEVCIAQFTHPSLADLFPGLQTSGNRKAYVPAGPMPRSIGYVRCPSVKPFVAANGNMRVDITDTDGASYDLPLKDFHLVNRIGGKRWNKVWYDVSVRFALAGPLIVPPLFENRCYVMVTHIVI